MWNLTGINVGSGICAAAVNEAHITAAIIRYVSAADAQLGTNLLMDPVE